MCIEWGEVFYSIIKLIVSIIYVFDSCRGGGGRRTAVCGWRSRWSAGSEKCRSLQPGAEHMGSSIRYAPI
jgi:hypothetical protein